MKKKNREGALKKLPSSAITAGGTGGNNGQTTPRRKRVVQAKVVGLVIAVGLSCILFFFQAEDGIRDPLVTGVQTCALPISVDGVERRLGLPCLGADLRLD